MNVELKKLIKNYLELIFWYSCNQDNKTLNVQQFTTVLSEIGRLEDDLGAKGLKPQQINWLIKYASDIANKPLSHLPENQQIKMIESIFGRGDR